MRTTQIIAFTLLAALAANVQAQDKKLADRWYIVQLNGQRVGYIHTTLTRNATQDLITKEVMVMRIKRDTTVLETSIETTTTENTKTNLFRSEQVSTSGNSKVTQQFNVLGKKGIEYMTAQNGRERKGTVPPTEHPLLSPEQARLLFKDQLEKDKKEYKFHTFEQSTGMKPVEIATTIKGREDIEVFGRVVPTIALERTNSAYPSMVLKEYVDEEGRMIKAASDVGGMKMEMLLADRELATAKIDPPEMLASSMIVPDKRIRGPRRVRKATYLLTLKSKADNQNAKQTNEKWTVELPTGGSQVATLNEKDEVRVEVNMDKLVRDNKDKPNKWHSMASTICDSDDKKIKELVADALKGLEANTKNEVKADRLRAYVQRYVRSKDLSVGFGHASEVARTRQGDCTEHAVLLAAMLRAADIPSRGVTGLVYADQFAGKDRVFVYHMWTQAWIEEKNGEGYWMDVDATLPRRAFDAAHIALASSVLNDMADDGSGNDMVKLLPLLGRLEVKVLEAK